MNLPKLKEIENLIILKTSFKMKNFKLSKNIQIYTASIFLFIVLFLIAINILQQKPKTSEQRVEKSCLTRKAENLTDLFQNRKTIWDSSRPECRQAEANLNRIFHLEIQNGSLKIPNAMDPVVNGWLGNDSHLYQKFLNPSLLFVKNKWSFTSTIRNPLRSSKPKQKRKGLIDYLITTKVLNNEPETHVSVFN